MNSFKPLTLFLLAFLSLSSVSSLTAVTVPPPFNNNSISSDFGPRLHNGFDFHGGLDYAQPRHTSIPSIEDGTVEFVRGPLSDSDLGGWRMKITGSTTGRSFFYMHMFSQTATTGAISGGFELGVYINADNSKDYYIKRISDGKIFSRPNATENRPAVSVTAGELIGPVGDSGSAQGSPHLHLQLGASSSNDLDNPFIWVDHSASNYSINLANPPVNNFTIPTSQLSNFSIKFQINTVGSLDLDAVRVSVNGTELIVPSDSVTPKVAFRYGGKKDQDTTASAFTSPGETTALPSPLTGNATFRVNPISNGLDEFIVENVSLSNLPDGNHTLRITPVNVLGVESGDTSIAFPIADPKFTVEREKLIF